MSKMNESIFVRPRWDDKIVDQRFAFLMDYAYWTGAEVVSYAHDQDFLVHELTEERAIRSELKNFLDYHNPVFFFHFSHGGTDKLTGQDMSVLICSNEFTENGNTYGPNDILLRNRVVYTLSCLSASELGPKSVEHGCISYIGYKDPLWAVVIEGADTDYALFEIWTGGAKALLDGKTIEETYYWLKRRYNFWITYWEMIDATNSTNAWKAPAMLMALEKNLKALTLLGNLNARIRGEVNINQ
ncbi:hypothetical protein ES702_05147 [subsurface metagenome]